jgi:TonB family protein
MIPMNNLRSSRFLYFLIAFTVSCLTPATSKLQESEFKKSGITEDEVQIFKTIFYVYHDGEFKETILSKEPELIGGKELMETLIRLNTQYPEVAKSKKIGGTVLISVVIDAEGRMEDVFVHEGIGGGCNEEALRSVKLLDHTGFEPGEVNGKPVTVKFDIPLTFLPK